jgi:hypothetical protein
MINVTAAEINAWVVAFLFPLARVLALLSRGSTIQQSGTARLASG